MKPILFAAFSIMLLMGMSCSPVRHGDTWVSSPPNVRSLKYKSADLSSHTITAIVTDSVENQPIGSATVELYVNNHMSEPLTTAFTSIRGKFSFNLTNGDYVIIIKHTRFKDREVIVSVRGWDIDLYELKLCPVSY